MKQSETQIIDPWRLIMGKILIWGSEGGIGQAILTHFLEQGWQAAAVARKLTSISTQAEWSFEADFSDPEQVAEVGRQLEEHQDPFDIFVYAAGDITAENIGDSTPKRWLEIIDNNLTGVFHTLQASLPIIKEDGHIFLLGAVSERLQLPGLSAYAAAKAGLEAFAVAFSKEERRKKVTVVRPGAVDTGLWDKVPFKKPSHTYPPVKVAERIREAYQDGHKGQLDLV
jgi:NAD(P)-dependent dehydrogenase (short-subunit alcohol dehydrogenase family)